METSPSPNTSASENTSFTPTPPQLRDYLYHHTYFEHPSTSRYDCGELHLLEDGRIVFNLPLQIRYSYAEG